MNVRKYFGSNSRVALQAVKRDLGADAVILSNRSVEGGVEIAALSADQMPRAPAQAAPAAARGAATAGTDPAPAPGAPVPAESVLGEIRALRSVLEEQLGGLVWGEMQRREPVQARLLRELLGAGFSPGLARFTTENLPAGMSAADGLRWLQAVLARNLQCAEDDQVVTRGGVYALMGPTGVGKTTTTAKLAARCVVRHGAERVALLTTDSYRIGAHEQLRIYGKILGVAVHMVRDASDLGEVLGSLQDKHVVLIDTVGMSQRDKAVADQVGMLCGAGRKLSRLLLLSACASAESMDETVRAYRGGDGLAGVILTKLDEAGALGGPLDVVLRHRLALHYVATGQRVPEDLQLPSRESLLGLALKPRAEEGSFGLRDAEVPAALAAARVGRTRPAALARS